MSAKPQTRRTIQQRLKQAEKDIEEQQETIFNLFCLVNNHINKEKIKSRENKDKLKEITKQLISHTARQEVQEDQHERDYEHLHDLYSRIRDYLKTRREKEEEKKYDKRKID